MSKLTLFRIDARTIRLQNARFLEEKNIDGEIIRLYKQNENVEVKTNAIIKHKNSLHKVNIIAPGVFRDKIVCYDLMSAALNTSSVFITPLLGFPKEDLFWDTHFVNAFMSTIEHDVCIALLFRFSGDVAFVKFESWIKTQPNFLASYDPDKHHVLYVFSVPEVGKEQYNKIRDGKYSEIDDLWKMLILHFHKFDRNGKTGKILYKDYSLKQELESKFDINLGDAELHSIPNMKYERFDPKYYAVSAAMIQQDCNKE